MKTHLDMDHALVLISGMCEKQLAVISRMEKELETISRHWIDDVLVIQAQNPIQAYQMFCGAEMVKAAIRTGSARVEPCFQAKVLS